MLHVHVVLVKVLCLLKQPFRMKLVSFGDQTFFRSEHFRKCFPLHFFQPLQIRISYITRQRFLNIPCIFVLLSITLAQLLLRQVYIGHLTAIFIMVLLHCNLEPLTSYGVVFPRPVSHLRSSFNLRSVLIVSELILQSDNPLVEPLVFSETLGFHLVAHFWPDLGIGLFAVEFEGEDATLRNNRVAQILI